MFTERELKIIYAHLVDMNYFRAPTDEEIQLIAKVRKMIANKHFNKE